MREASGAKARSGRDARGAYAGNAAGKGIVMLAGIIQKQRTERFAGLRGADIRGSLPVREALLEPLLQQGVRDSNGNIQRLAVHIHEANTLVVEATVYLLFFRKDVRLQLRIDPVVDFAVSPVMTMHIVEAQGIPGFVLEFLLNLLPFPESIEILPKRITINLKTALTRRKLDEFVPLLRRLSLSTRPGCAMIEFHVGVD